MVVVEVAVAEVMSVVLVVLVLRVRVVSMVIVLVDFVTPTSAILMVTEDFLYYDRFY